MGARNHAYWMGRCLELARAARGRGNTAVGSLLVYRGALLTEAEEESPGGPDPFGHSELIAVRRALALCNRQDLHEATLYSTAEPCFMCSYAIRRANIGHVVMGSKTAGIGGASSAYPILIADDVPAWDSPPRVTWGVLEEACDDLRRKPAS